MASRPIAFRCGAAPVLAALLALASPEARGRVAEASALPAPREVASSLTLYTDGRSWVRETAIVPILRGEAVVPWPRAVASLEPETFSARVLEGPARVTGVTPPHPAPDLSLLLQGWVGREVDLVQFGEDLTEKVTRGVLLGLPGGRPLLLAEGTLWIDPPGSLRLPLASGAPAPGPQSAAVDLSAAGGGKVRLEVSYRAPGLSWSAEYRAVRAGEVLDFEGWLTLRNDTEISFPRAAVKLLAGEVQREAKTLPILGRSFEADVAMAGVAPAAPVEREALGATHLYTLQAPVDLPAGGRARRLWVSRDGLPARLRHRLESPQGVSYGGDSGSPPAHPYTIVTVEKGAFDQPLPAGVVRLFERDASGDLQEVGEDSIVHLPAGSPLDLRTGRTFDILAERRQTEQRPGGRVGPAELACEIRLTNAGRDAATVEVREFFNGRWQIEDSSHAARRVDARTAEFLLPVPAGGETTLTYRASIRY